jgi:hypothetical protein
MFDLLACFKFKMAATMVANIGRHIDRHLVFRLLLGLGSSLSPLASLPLKTPTYNQQAQKKANCRWPNTDSFLR